MFLFVEISSRERMEREGGKRECGDNDEEEEGEEEEEVFALFVGCLASPQHANVSQGRICSDKFTCCHTEIEVANSITVY